MNPIKMRARGQAGKLDGGPWHRHTLMYIPCVAILKLMQKLGNMICGDRSKSSPPHASFLFTKFTLHALHI